MLNECLTVLLHRSLFNYIHTWYLRYFRDADVHSKLKHYGLNYINLSLIKMSLNNIKMLDLPYKDLYYEFSKVNLQ